MKLIQFILLTFVSWFVVPFLLRYAKEEKKDGKVVEVHLTHGRAIWGNNQDGVDGDARWYDDWVAAQKWYVNPIAKLFPRYWWTAWRNPCENWRVSIGINGIVKAIIVDGDDTKTGLYKATATVLDGTCIKVKHFTQYKWKWPFFNRYYVFKYGPKIWKNTEVGDKINNAFAFSIFKPFTTASDAGINGDGNG